MDEGNTLQSISGLWAILGLGMFGGLAIEVMRWWKLRMSENLPHFARSWLYWLTTAAMIVLGGLLATLYGIDDRNPIAVVQLGASAPALLGALASGQDLPAGGNGGNIDDSSELAGAKKGKDTTLFAKRAKGRFTAFLSFKG